MPSIARTIVARRKKTPLRHERDRRGVVSRFATPADAVVSPIEEYLNIAKGASLMRQTDKPIHDGHNITAIAKGKTEVEHVLHAIDRELTRSHGLEFLNYQDEHSHMLEIVKWEAPDNRKLPTKPGWWRGTDKSVIYVYLSRKDNKTLAYNDYIANYHGFAIHHLPENVDWEFLADTK
jgi:hypothetical protein